MRKVVILCSFLLAFSPRLRGQDSVYERILLPVVLADPVPGAFDSLWATRLKAHAEGSRVTFRAFFICGACLPDYVIEPRTTVDLPVLGRLPYQPSGALIYMHRSDAPFVQFNLRVQDLSRQALTWGTELPVVRERDFFTTPLTLINIPIDSRFRSALRIYDVDSNDSTVFRIQIFDDTTGESLVDDLRQVQSGREPEGPMRIIPSTVEFTSLVAAYPQVASAAQLRVTIAPTTSARFWAFVSVTNNETQHVTIISPQQ